MHFLEVVGEGKNKKIALDGLEGEGDIEKETLPDGRFGNNDLENDFVAEALNSSHRYDSFRADCRIVGQVMGTYIIVENSDGVELIDQHAAHERIMYEQLKKRSDTFNPPSQQVIVPHVLDFNFTQSELFERMIPGLNELGFEIEPFGPQTIILRTLPSHINAEQAEAFLKDLLGEMQREGSTAERQDRALHTMACRAAVKFGDRLTPDDMTGIIRGLESIPRRNVCPHGRPSILYVGDGDLRKLFKRTGFD